MWRNKLILISKSFSKNLKNNIKQIEQKYDLKNYKSDFFGWTMDNFPMKYKDVITDELWNIIMPYSVNYYLNKNKPYCTSSQIKELYNNGFEIGSHSHTHPDFSKLNINEISDEIQTSSDFLSNIIDNDISFSYPFGLRANSKLEKSY